MTFKGWQAVADELRQLSLAPDAAGSEWRLDEGQRRSLRAVANRILSKGVIVADEVGMGKTRIAVAIVRAVVQAGGRAVIMVPPGLGFQWQDELKIGGIDHVPLLRSLRQYLDAWSEHGAGPWHRESVILLSHAFTNWRLGQQSEPWRWALLPALFARWRKEAHNRAPRHSRGNRLLQDHRVLSAADAIAERADAEPHVKEFLEKLLQESLWPAALKAENYRRNGDLRHSLEGAVGLGLGPFELVMIDEAHKSRGDMSGLARLQKRVAVASPCARRVALTATPIELDAGQWIDILERIGLSHEQTKPVIDHYVEACRQVQELPMSGERVQTFALAAERFKAALDPFLVRRDKRESDPVLRFERLSGEPPHAYRRESAIEVRPEDLDARWRRAVCAAEALSAAAAGGLDPRAQRLRLTLGSGHGINDLLDRHCLDLDDDASQLVHDDAMRSRISRENGTPDGEAIAPADEKRTQRVNWWLKVLRNSVSGAERQDILMEHPGLNAAVRVIEAAHRQGEKVLVFGRYTRPMRALVSLLNARQMLVALNEGHPWSQAVIPAEEEVAVQAASRQLGLFQDESLAEIGHRLSVQYAAIEERRRHLRESLVGLLERGLSAAPQERLLVRLFEAFRQRPEDIPIVVRALTEVLDPEERSTEAWAWEFRHLVEATLERDETDEDSGSALNDNEVKRRWELVADRLGEEFGRREGGFARLMYGKTRPSTRRLLQLAFNRINSFPRVLVAQSVVGREGLNLHRACRTVILLHPEWNPGVVEQQIGRVDRLNSRWEQLLTEAEDRSGSSVGEVPRIEIMPVIFNGTYDEHNWKVLRRRWSDLRAQLHGVVIQPSFHGVDPELTAVARVINAKAPSFSPKD